MAEAAECELSTSYPAAAGLQIAPPWGRRRLRTGDNEQVMVRVVHERGCSTLSYMHGKFEHEGNFPELHCGPVRRCDALFFAR